MQALKHRSAASLPLELSLLGSTYLPLLEGRLHVARNPPVADEHRKVGERRAGGDPHLHSGVRTKLAPDQRGLG